MKVQEGRKYKTRSGYRVEIDCFDRTKDAEHLIDSNNSAWKHVVLGRILLPTDGWATCQWTSDGRFDDHEDNDLDLIDNGPDPRTVAVEMHEAIAIKEIQELCEYIMEDGIDPELFNKHDRDSFQSTTARVIFDLIIENAAMRKAATMED